MERKKAFMWSADSGGVAQKEISNVCVDLIKKAILSILAVRHESQRVGTPGLGSTLGTYWPTKLSNKWRCS